MAALGVLVALAPLNGLGQVTNNPNYPQDLSVSVNATAQFRVGVLTATPPYTIRWWFNDVAIDPQLNPRAASWLLVISNVTLAQGGRYWAVVSDATGSSATSRVATLDVDPTFTKITLGPLVSDGLDNWHGFWGDYDNDGRLDLLTAGNAGSWRLYHNDGNTQFSTVSQGVMGEFGSRGMWGVWADPDNDGDLDVLASPGPTMFWNDGSGNFARVGASGGWATGPFPDPGWFGGGAWGDFDRDGFLDCFLGANGRNVLLHNNGNTTFTSLVVSNLTLSGDSIQVTAVVDYDNDGDLDLVVARYQGRRTQFYRNDGSGNFEEATPEPIRSELTHTLTSAWGDFDNDGDLDVFFGGYDNLPEHFYINNGDGTFSRWTGQPALFEPDGSLGSFAAWGDFDNDGYLDLAICKYGPAKKLWRNQGDGTFAEVHAGSVTAEDGSCDQTISWADFNGDGNLDLFVARTSGNADKLFMGNGNGNHWLEVKPRGVASDRLAVGAKIFATATIRGKVMRQMRVITASDADETLVAHFGLGDATNVATLRIEWPLGIVQELQNVAANQIVTVTEHQEGATNAPSLAVSKSADDQVQLTAAGPADLRYVFEASTNITRWTKIAVRTNLTGTVEYTPEASAPQCFHRVVVP